MREKLRLEIPEDGLKALTTASRSRTASVRSALRAKIVLCRHGATNVRMPFDSRA